MTDKDSFTERGRALEDEYFRKKDRELIEKMRLAAAGEQARSDLAARTGLDAASVAELQALGFTPETLPLLPLVPLVQVAWAEGGVTSAERAQIVSLARSRGIADGDAADRQLSAWLEVRPSESTFAQATRLIGAMLDSPSGALDLTADELVRYCESIAEASGGFFGINRVGSDEKQILSSIAETLKNRS